MKVLVFFVLCFVAHEVAPQMRGLTFCDAPAKGAKKATAPKKGVYYQQLRPKKTDKTSCYNFNLIEAKASIRLNETLVNDKVVLKQSYVANATTDGRWNLTLNNRPSSQILMTSSGKYLIIQTCLQSGVLNLQPGVYSQSKDALPKADKEKVMKAFKLNAKDVEDVAQTKCKN